MVATTRACESLGECHRTLGLLALLAPHRTAGWLALPQAAGKQDREAAGADQEDGSHQTDPELHKLELQHALDRQAVEQIRTRLAAVS